MVAPVLYHQRSFGYVLGILVLACAVLWLADVKFGINRSLFLWLNQSDRVPMESLVELITYLGEAQMSVFFLLCLLIRRMDSSVRLVAVILLVALLTHLLKLYYDTPRPSAVFPLAEINVIGDSLKRYSMPSGHTSTAFALTGFVWLHFKSYQLPLIVLLFAGLVGWSRIAVGAHWPLDVALGAVIGYISPAIVLGFIKSSGNAKLNHGIFAFLFASVGALSAQSAMTTGTSPLIVAASAIVAVLAGLFTCYHGYLVFRKQFT